MTFNFKRFGAAALAVLMVMSVFGMAVAGTAAAEEETTIEETIVLEGDDTDAVDHFNASEDRTLEYTFEADGADFDEDGTEDVYVNVTYDGVEHADYDAAVDGADSEYTVELDTDDLESVPGDAGADVDVEVNVWGEDLDGEITTGETVDEELEPETFDVTLEFQDGYAVMYVDDDTTESEELEAGFLSLDTFTFGALGDDDEQYLYTHEETVTVNKDTTVTAHDASDGADEFADLADERDDGDVIYSASAAVDGTPVLAFQGEADEDLVDVDADTYAVHEGDGVWTFNAGDDYEDGDEIDIFLESQSYASADFDAADLNDVFLEQADLGMTGAFSAFGVADTLSAFSVMDLMPLSAGVGGLLAAGFVVSRRIE